MCIKLFLDHLLDLLSQCRRVNIITKEPNIMTGETIYQTINDKYAAARNLFPTCLFFNQHIYTQQVFLSGVLFCQTDDDSATALSNTGKEGGDENVQYAAPHSMDPVHVDKKELHTGHDQPGVIQGQCISSAH